jgi:lipopolysaccharide/colanic/teichoic acid biosynthesis glycosyltransferase
VLHHGSSSSPRGPIDAPGLLGAADGAGAVRPVPGLFGAQVPLDFGERAGAARPVALQGGVIPAERSELANRVLNVIIAGLALLILAPVCVLVALVVKLTSPGPVFYTQTRVGLDRRWRRGAGADTPGAADEDDRRLEDLGGQPFTILKFRSMRVDAEAGGQAVWATKHDPRITPVGRVLRKTRLDEVPQLINVLRGEMNIVGPRPERPSIVVRLREHVGEYPVRHRVKPGITGWAQINHSYDASIEDVRTKVRYDLEYIRQQGLLFDLKIMALTLPVMVFKRGAH